MYILQDRKACAKGDAGIWFPKRDLATGKIAVKAAVKEVVGRSLYYLQNHRHFAYASAAPLPHELALRLQACVN